MKALRWATSFRKASNLKLPSNLLRFSVISLFLITSSQWPILLPGSIPTKTIPKAIRITPIHPALVKRSCNHKAPRRVPIRMLPPTMTGILCVAWTPIPLITKESSSAAPTAAPAARDQTSPDFVYCRAPALVVRCNSNNMVPMRAATNCNKTPPRIGSMEDEAFLINKL